MSKINIKTTLGVVPFGCHCNCKHYKEIYKGSTAILSIPFSNTDYLVDYDADGNLDFNQLTLVIKQPNTSLYTYSYYSETGLIDGHFSYDKLTEMLDFTLSAEETADMQSSDVDTPTEWEIAITTKDGYVIISKQEPFILLDSIYNTSTGHGTQTPYASNTCLCSSSLICND